MRDFLEYVVKGLADHPDDVRIESSLKEGTTVYQLRIHPEDMGRIIGRGGQTVNAIRALMQAGSARRNMRSLLKVEEIASGGPAEDGGAAAP